jgi:thymidylate synthase (FAD)
MNIALRSDVLVRTIQHVGGDHSVVAAAKVSTSGEESLRFSSPGSADECRGLINYLMKHRHGSPFEHSSMSFYVEAPIFVWREWMRHRIGWSYNEQSGRYGELQPVFWVPTRSRPSYPVSGWKPGRPKFVTGDEKFGNPHSADTAHMDSIEAIRHAYMAAWSAYQSLISRDVALEVARTVLPVGIYSRAWVTCNPRSLMHFLSLRTHDPNAKFVSYPQLEIDLAAQTCEAMLKKHWPITHKAFLDNGRVAP